MRQRVSAALSIIGSLVMLALQVGCEKSGKDENSSSSNISSANITSSESDGPIGGEGTPTIKFASVPARGSFDNLSGSVLHVRPDAYKVAVFIRVGSGYWTKPYWTDPLTTIDSGGGWSCDITTGGADETANQIVAFLVPAGYTPPLLAGQNSLPSELSGTAVSSATASR